MSPDVEFLFDLFLLPVDACAGARDRGRFPLVGPVDPYIVFNKIEGGAKICSWEGDHLKVDLAEHNTSIVIVIVSKYIWGIQGNGQCFIKGELSNIIRPKHNIGLDILI